MSFPSPRSWSIRWKGETRSFSDWQDIEEALSRGDLSLMHEVRYLERWWSLKDFLRERPWEEKRVVVEPVSLVEQSEGIRSDGVRDHKEADPHAEHDKPVALLPVMAGGGVCGTCLFILLSAYPLAMLICALLVIAAAFFLILKGERYWPWLGIGLLVILAIAVISALAP